MAPTSLLNREFSNPEQGKSLQREPEHLALRRPFKRELGGKQPFDRQTRRLMAIQNDLLDIRREERELAKLADVRIGMNLRGGKIGLAC